MNVARYRVLCWTLAGLVLSALCLSGCHTETADEQSAGDSADRIRVPDFSQEVQAVLDRRIGLVEELAAEDVVVDAVRAANRENDRLDAADIARLDEKWRAGEGLDDLSMPLLTNRCAQQLVGFQDAHDGFPEIFVTDDQGLVVAATNRTSDYLQADELWWQAAYNEGQGSSFHGEIEYDESAYSESIPLHVPVIDPGSGKAIGVLKAVCDITAIKMEL